MFDLRFALRSLVRAPKFMAAAALTFALGPRGAPRGWTPARS